ncbi:MAG: rsgA [Modestobacter sp.]|nr:rsgA [Modestobacter sp.]MCW2617201.1 rsgA [Modestobacter sp.]
MAPRDELTVRVLPRGTAFVRTAAVGTSSLANALAGRPVASTAGIRQDGRGRHTTTARELRLLPGGGLLVDTPGMRELALPGGDGLDTTYADVAGWAAEFRFRNCAHRTAPNRAARLLPRSTGASWTVPGSPPGGSRRSAPPLTLAERASVGFLTCASS